MSASPRFLAHLWLVRAEVARAKRRGWRIGREDARQAAMLGLLQADRRAPAELSARDFVAFATFRVRGAIIDEARLTTPGARRTRGDEPQKPRCAAPGLVEMMRDAGLLPELSFDEGQPALLATEPSPEEQAERNEIVGLIRQLPARTQAILRRRVAGATERSIGLEYGVSEARICQILRETVGKLAAIGE